jgi:Holliday junction resolvase RusA-like endonuclease
MATGAGGFTFDEKYETNSLYQGGVTGYNPNIENTSGAYWNPEAERKWKERAAEINAQRRLEKKIETKVYKRLIKELLKKI